MGLLLAAAGLLLFARAPVGGHFNADVLPSIILLGFGAGLAFNPVLLAAMGDVDASESGLASGIVNISFASVLGVVLLRARDPASGRPCRLDACQRSCTRARALLNESPRQVSAVGGLAIPTGDGGATWRQMLLSERRWR